MISSKGSLWRKWDFHVHTPASSIAVNFGNDWDEYVKKLVSASLEAEVDAIGVTDYFSVEGYKKLKNDYFGNLKKLESLFQDEENLLQKAKSLYLFPNIELRLNCFVGDASINYHVIFSDLVKVEDIEEYFLGEIDFVYQGRPQDDSLKMKIKKSNLEALGGRIRTEQTTMIGSAYDIGLKSAVVNVDKIKEVLKANPTRFAGKYLLGLPSDEDLSSVSWDGRDGDIRRQLISGVDFIFCSNPSTINWAVGKKVASKEEFLKEFKSFKPCIWGSDAHDYHKLFRPSKDRHCWVKSDLSFDGLKQIKYEAESRVFISATKPDEKINYYVIDKVRFRDGPNLTFSTDWIEVNSNLTTIIGGKSAGKSLLLYYLAKTISPDETDKLKSSAGKAPYECENDQNFDFEVVWADGEQNTLRQDKSERKKNITYLPQLYINSLVEGKSRKDLDKLIENVLLENSAYAEERQRFDSSCRANNAQIEQSITHLFSILEQKTKTAEAIIKLGDKAAHAKQVESLKNRISELEKESSLTKEEKDKFDELIKKRKESQDSKNATEIDQQYIQGLHDLLSSRSFQESIDTLIEECADDVGLFDQPSEAVNQLSAKVQAILTEDMNASVLKAAGLVGIELQKTQKKAADSAATLKTVNEELAPYASKFKNREELKKNEEQLKSQALVIIQFETLEKKLSEINDEIGKTKLKIWEQRGKYREVYQSFLDFIKSASLDKIADDIKLIVGMKFDEDDFHSSVIEYLNLTTLKKIFNDNYDEHNQRLKEVTIETFKVLLEAILNGEIKLKAAVKKDDLLRRLLRNYLSINFNLKHKEDDLFKMSPGKRGIVVLKLLLHLSNSRDPILIDQPEDNLDNRTIYEELNSFIKEKKTLRQIIMVTHNANLVVSTDAEEVIVCNQSGQHQGRDNLKYRFEYTSGPLENSFVDTTKDGVLFGKGIKEHVCEVLEGGREAFINRQTKYELS